MRSFFLLSLLTLAVEKVSSQAGAWEKCGGDPWTGPTTCITGYFCSYSNQWYSQCLPGTPPAGTTTTAKTSSSTTLSTIRTTTTTTSKSSSTSTTTKSTTTLSTTTRTSSSSSSSSSTTKSNTAVVSSTTTLSGACPSFTAVSASAAIAALNPGWNLGNTLDAVPDEGSWNNPPATLLTLQQIKAKGFNSVRVPVTWTHHFDSEAPDYIVNAAWMNRVEVVIDQALSTGLWVILNVHHDSWGWMDYASGASIPVIEAKFASLWSQIGTRFKCKSSKLIFEAINEPTGSTEAHAIELNKLNDIFLTAINVAGGANSQRVVSLSGLNQDATRTSQWFKRGTLYPNQPWALQFHYYSPYDFVFDAWGRTIWGSAADKAVLTSEFQLIKGNFSGVPTFIGEWDASPQNTEPAARWTYNDYFVKEANRLGFSHILWDNGLDHFNRPSNTFYDPVAIDVILKGTAGISNALPDATTDTSLTTQSSSAFLFHKVGAAVTAQSVKYNLNGNTLVSIKTAAGAVVPASSYSIAADGTLTFTSTYLSSLYTSTAPAGIKETLTLTFSAGAALQLKIVQYDTPTTPSTTFSLSALSGDLTIPLTYKGLPTIAAVKALKADGTYLVDDWTVYLGPLQNARWTQGQWFWSAEGWVLYATGLAVLKAAGQSVTVTLEFFPRVPGNELVLVFNP